MNLQYGKNTNKIKAQEKPQIHETMKKHSADEIRRGLPMVETRDPEALESERRQLRHIAAQPRFWQRWKGYWGLSGPGWVQSALTLGAGSASSAIFAGSVFGYKLLWVQPVAMLLGIVVFAAIGHQVLSTRARPYDVFWKELHPSVALLWGLNVFLASVVWQFPQYSLGTAVLKDIFAVFGVGMPKGVLALLLLALGTLVCWSYEGGSRKAIRRFERFLKYMLMLMVAAFFLVVVKTGIHWGELLRGYFTFHHSFGQGGDYHCPGTTGGGRGSQHDIPLSLHAFGTGLGQGTQGPQKL